MSDLEIPDRAWEAGSYYKQWGKCVEAVAPIIVAARLRQWAQKYADAVGPETPNDTEGEILWCVVRDLRADADELDPPGGQP